MKNADTPLVSLITPCRNGAPHLKPYLDGLLSQTYENVQYIFVNDGSGDATEEIILSHENTIRAKGWDFVYIRQKQAGQAAAVNAALKVVRGKYFSQIDSDDILYPHYLEKYCDFLENNPSCKFCYARVAVAKENFLDKPYKIRCRHIAENSRDDFFSDLLNEINVPPLPFYMIEVAAFLKVAQLPLYENKAGQNWQILLPMAYHYKCGYIDEVLAVYVERKTSHSHSQSHGGNSDRWDDLKKILFHTVSRLNIPDGEKAFYYGQITKKFFLLQALPRDYDVKLFGRIPILKIRRRRNKISLRLFNVLSIATITVDKALKHPTHT